MKPGVTELPLSEDEQRILHDIERNFYEQDPSFARAVSRPVNYRNATRNCKLAAAGMVVGLIVVLGTFIRFPLVAFAGFLLMAVSAGVFAQNVRRVGTGALLDDPESHTDFGTAMRATQTRLRDRFRRKA